MHHHGKLFPTTTCSTEPMLATTSESEEPAATSGTGGGLLGIKDEPLDNLMLPPVPPSASTTAVTAPSSTVSATASLNKIMSVISRTASSPALSALTASSTAVVATSIPVESLIATGASLTGAKDTSVSSVKQESDDEAVEVKQEDPADVEDIKKPASRPPRPASIPSAGGPSTTAALPTEQLSIAVPAADEGAQQAGLAAPGLSTPLHDEKSPVAGGTTGAKQSGDDGDRTPVRDEPE